MSNLSKMRKELYFEVVSQREKAWHEKDFNKSMEIRKEQQKNFDKLQLLNGIIKANEKGKKDGKGR